MSSLYRRNGIYWLSFRQHGKGYCISLRTRDRSTAIYRKAEKDKELIEGRAQLPHHDISCLPALEEYLKYNEHRRVKRFNADSASRIRRFLEWGNIRTINQITEERLQEYLNHRMSHDKIGLYAANNIIICVKAWLNWCVRTRKIFENPVKDIKKFKVPESTRRFLSKEEAARLLTGAQDETLYPLVATAVYTGLRKDELFNLQWEDIDFVHGVVTVKNKAGFTTKSKKNRSIPLHPDLRRILFPLRKAEGRCFDITNHRRIFRRIVKRAGLGGLKLHELRHTFASQALMAGVPLVTVSKWLGHSSVVTTQIYSHFCRDHKLRKLRFFVVGKAASTSRKFLPHPSAFFHIALLQYYYSRDIPYEPLNWLTFGVQYTISQIFCQCFLGGDQESYAEEVAASPGLLKKGVRQTPWRSISKSLFLWRVWIPG